MDPKLLVLDRLKNIITSTREVEEMLLDKAKGGASSLVSGRYSVQAARIMLRNALTKWLSDNGYTGHGSTKLVGKAMRHALKNYEARLNAALLDDIRKAKQAGNGWRYLQKAFEAGTLARSVDRFPWVLK